MATVKESTPFLTPVKAYSSNDEANGGDSIQLTNRGIGIPSSSSEIQNDQHVHRVLDRNGDFHQSRGKLSIRKMMKKSLWNRLYSHDWFHSLIDAPTHRVLFLLLVYYVCVISTFALMYYAIAVQYEDCGLGILNFLEAYTFSLQTMATIGFGVGAGDIFFGDCYSVIGVLSAHVLVKNLSEAVIIGVIYSRISRPMKRATTILFSDHAVIRRIRDRVYFMFQLCELRKHQLTEAHVRLYAVRNERDPEVGGEVAFFQTCSMRLNHPNDELGSGLLLCLPQVVVHEMDISSPLVPPAVWASATKLHHWKQEDLKQRRGVGTSESVLEVDLPSASKSEHTPRFPEVAMRSPARVGTGTGKSEAKSSYLNDSKSGAEDPRHLEEQEMVSSYMKDRSLEVIAIVEGNDAATGGVVQARHSYTVSEMEWNAMFVPCVSQGQDGSAVIDFSKFHSMRSVSLNASHCGVVSSHI